MRLVLLIHQPDPEPGGRQSLDESGPYCDWGPVITNPFCQTKYVTSGGTTVARGCSDETPNGTRCTDMTLHARRDADCQGPPGPCAISASSAPCVQFTSSPTSTCTPVFQGANNPCECRGGVMTTNSHGSRTLCPSDAGGSGPQTKSVQPDEHPNDGFLAHGLVLKPV